MVDMILLIALDSGSIADVRWGKVGESRCRFAARQDLAENGGELAAMAQGSQVVVLVPTRYVFLRQTVFQGKPRMVTPKALAYPHESELLTDVDQMHWAILSKAQHRFGIAGVAMAQMHSWINLINACGIRADKMLPDALALPLPGQCSALRWGRQWLIRTGEWQGMQLPDEWLDYSSLPMPDWCFHQGGEVPMVWQDVYAEGDPLWQLAEEASRSKFNLLQGDFKLAPRWLCSMSCMVICALFLFSCSLLTSGLYYQLMAGKIESQIQALSLSLQPGQPTPVFPEKAARERIKQLQTELNAPQLFKLLPYAAEALSSLGQPTLQSLTFNSAENHLVASLLTDGSRLSLPNSDTGINISLSEGSKPNQVIMRVGGEK